MPIPRVKEVLGSEDQLCERNCPMAKPNGGYPVASVRWPLTSVKGKNGETGGSCLQPVAFIGREQRGLGWASRVGIGHQRRVRPARQRPHCS
jgi:hypothetical protein